MADMRDNELELFFEAARADAPEPSDGLMARILADAEAQMPVAQATGEGALRRPGLWAGVLAAIGGWPAVAGLATATVAGIWIGYAQPGGVETLTTDLLGTSDGYDVVDLLPSYDGFLGEG